MVDLRVDEVRYPDGHTGIREVVEHPGGAVVAPFDSEGNLILIRQYRHPASDHLYELPAGKLEQNEPAEQCALRELEEESGYTAPSLVHLASIYTTPGFCDEVLHLYMAENVTPHPGGQRLDPGESLLTVHPTPIDRVGAMISAGQITDAKTICAYYLAREKLGETPPRHH